MSEQLAGLRGTNCGATRVDLAIDGARPTLRVHARWMGQDEIEVRLDCEHRVLGSHSGALLVETARSHDERRPLPPSDGALIIEYEVPPAQFEPVVRALRWIEQPWKLGAAT